MCCGGSANWKREEVPDHKFDFIDVRDYRTNGFFTRLRYVWLYLMVFKGFAVLVADIYTAVTLLAFGHFNGDFYERVQNDPNNNFRVPITYARWIFTGCILFSFLLLAYEAHKARAIVKSRDISYAYTNVMANDWYSLRSYDHFCFFCQINNSKKKKDEFAFFIFFTFKGWKRLLVADGPRQVINFFTLYGLGSLADWSTDPYDYYKGNIFTGLMILTMLFTVAVFAASMFLLILAAITYIPLLCYIKGNLKEYCCHKIDKRIAELVKHKKKQRLLKQAAIARKEAAGDFSHLMNKKGEMVGQAIPQPTLPNVGVDLTDEKPGAPLNRTNSAGSSTAVHGNGYYGEKGNQRFYGTDYGSSANLLKNAGPAGADGIPSLPTSHDGSPDTAPVHFHGLDPLLNKMGPIGTSPMLYAQRVGGNGGRASPAPGDGYYPSNGARTLVDPMDGAMSGTPAFGPRKVGPSPLNPDVNAPGTTQHMAQHSQGLSTENPYAGGGLDYPPPMNTHGVDGLDFPPPAPPDMSSYVPYNGVDVNDGAQYYEGGQGYAQTAVPAYFDGQSSTLHEYVEHPSSSNMRDAGASGHDAYYEQNGHLDAHAGANTGTGERATSGAGYEDLYDAYMTSHNASEAVTPERRNSGVVDAYGQAVGQDWQSHSQGYDQHAAYGDGQGYDQSGWDHGNGYHHHHQQQQQYEYDHQQQHQHQQHYPVDYASHGQVQQDAYYDGGHAAAAAYSSHQQNGNRF